MPASRHAARFFLGIAFLAASIARADAASGCVWKVTAPSGGTLFLGGSVHALRSSDYPLPPAYNRAFDASSRLVFEVDDKGLTQAGNELLKSGQYAKGDSLKNHVDPRTYDYLRRVFALMKVPEEKFARYRPWVLIWMMQSGSSSAFKEDLGVEEFLLKRARATSKPIFGLETVSEHARVFSGLNDRQGEALLLLTFIPHAGSNDDTSRVMDAWRRGDADSLARAVHESFSDFPAFGRRILDERNQRWIPKLEGYLRSGQTYFVVAGAGHMGGPGGVLNLMRERGYRIEQW
ncbi:MAG: TraB/GumN family protein [Verrucomicrobiota bacterium]|nr:TraB/GumN family protein [Verrucomicrobiota bacterium]